jgi:TolB-like protein/Tfp pilus assembly protein PilF
VAEASHAVFLSYASQDAEAAQKVAEALRAGSIEVFLDQSELRGGDAWDQKIRHEIHDCALFVPIISHHSQERLEGYFRHEWNLAIERAHHMARQKPFLVPVVVDGTDDKKALVPDEFRAVQWTRLPGVQTPAAFVERIKRLLSPDVAPATQAPASAVPGAAPGTRSPVRVSRRSRPMLLAIFAVVVLATPVAYFWISKHPAPATAAFAPPAHSIAVLPFVNMSGEKEQEYFSEGLTEEILNSLADISTLQVAARTSSFYFKGKDVDLGTIARKLNVGAILEGSVRRSGNTVRITTQLINAVTGYHLWSHTYDRDLGDVLKLETEIAGAVASALKVSLLGEVAAKIELGGTRNPAAFDAYLRGRKAFLAAHDEKSYQTAIAAFTEAIGLDPNYALAFANRSIALSGYAGEGASGPAIRESYDKAQEDARKAIALAPDSADGHTALANYFDYGALDFTRANEEYERALALAPGNAQALSFYGRYAAYTGRGTDAGIAAARRAVMLDPLSRASHFVLGQSLYYGRQNKEAIAPLQDAVALDPEHPGAYAQRGLAYYALGDFERARASCESKPDYWANQQCLAVIYEKLGRRADAEAMLAKMKADNGDTTAYQYATIYAQWGNTAKALEWLAKALELRDPGLVELKTDPLMDPLRKEPRFQAVMRELKFPD